MCVTLSTVAPCNPYAYQKRLQSQTTAYTADEAHSKVAVAAEVVSVLKGLVAVC